jgi:hypothetical protein
MPTSTGCAAHHTAAGPCPGGIDCRDPNDAYLIALARQSGADALVSGDRDLAELDDPRPPVLTPAAVLDRWDPVPQRPFRTVRGTFQVVLSGPKSGERRVHRRLQAAGFITQRTSVSTTIPPSLGSKLSATAATTLLRASSATSWIEPSWSARWRATSFAITG